MVNRDEENVTRKRRPPADERLRSKSPGASDSSVGARRERPAFRPVTRAGAAPAPSVLPPFFKIPNGSAARRGPSYPAWEKPPTPYDFPRLRGREVRKPMWVMWPPIFAAIGVAVVLFALVVLPALMGHGGNAAVASPSASSAAGHFIGPSGGSVGPASNVGSGGSGSVASPSIVSNGSPGPQPSYQQYEVQAGDTATRIAKRFGLKTWELLLANPDLADPNNLRIGSALNIPQPGQLTPPPPTPTDSPGPS
jgi:LysM repeat protein